MSAVDPRADTDGKALVISQSRAVDYSLAPVVSISTALARLKELQEYVKAVMVPGVHYGKIPGTDRPTLLKPGAEMLCEIYGLVPTVEVTQRVEDWGSGFVHYESRCRLVSKALGIVVAEGVGSCNTRERRYRNQDVYSTVNTVLKMAAKRALIDATLHATRSSGQFTQDVEDPLDLPHPPPAAAVAPTKALEGPTSGKPKVPSPKEVAALRDRAEALGLPTTEPPADNPEHKAWWAEKLRASCSYEECRQELASYGDTDITPLPSGKSAEIWAAALALRPRVEQARAATLSAEQQSEEPA